MKKNSSPKVVQEKHVRRAGPTVRARGSAQNSKSPGSSGAPRVGKLAEVVAERIRQEIVNLGWPVGQVLGNEVQLIERYRVSRATLREAIRQVERHGIAEMRRGLGGGLVVQEPARTAAVFSLASYLEFIATSTEELFETRIVIETLAVQLATKRMTDVEASRLREHLRVLTETSVRDLEGEAERHFALRGCIADLAHNPAAALLTDALTHLSANVALPGLKLEAVLDAIRQARSRAAAITDAIISGDELKAQQAVIDDLNVTRELIEEQAHQFKKNGAKRKSGKSNELLASSSPNVVSRRVDQKLGHRVSVAICKDIDARGWPLDEKLGSEPELQKQYGVSRAVLREAIRSLERHDILRMRRGNGGGIVIGMPDPKYTLATTVSYLSHAKLKAHHFYEVWCALQLVAVQRAAKRISPAIEARLLHALESENAVSARDLATAMSDLHALIAEISGNRVVALFCQAIDQVALKYPTGVPPEDVAQLMRQSHRDLCSALVSKDSGMARRAMTRHFKLIDAWFGEASRRTWLANAKARTSMKNLLT